MTGRIPGAGGAPAPDRTHATGRRARSRTARLLAAAGVGALAIGALAGCGQSAVGRDAGTFELTAHTPQPAGDIDSFTWALATEPYSLDPAYAFDYADNTVLSNMCESLLRWNSDLSQSPGLATAVDHPDPLSWVYTIREGVRFHDGTPMTPNDVVVSLSRHLDPEVASFWYDSFKNVDTIEQTGEHEVTVRTVVPDSQFNQLMSAAPGVIQSAQSTEQAGADYGNQSTGVNCTGPFSFGEWRAGESITLERFDDYWDPELRAKAEQMTFVVLNDPNARVNALQTGEIDGAWTIPSNAIDVLRASDTGSVYFGTNATVQSLIVSDMEGPLGDARVRQALTMAIDREALVRAAVQGYGSPSDALTSESVWINGDPDAVREAFDDLPDHDYDLEAARELVREAGAEGAKITYVTASLDSSFDVISQAVASAGREIGLDIEIETRTPNAYTLLFSDPTAIEGVDLFATTWYLSSTDPLEMYAVIRTGEFSNYGQWSNPEFDDVVNRALQTDDAGERSFLSAEAQRIASEELPWIPLIDLPTTLWMGDRITGVDPSISYMYYPWAATIGRAER
ncbi:peptide ABC transporter substrate-binding protein [Leucobacter sp. UCD-THU]|uniref:ABC transporter substrate-binding protein n=1 Tax=Leucobacter sp. UCD-THU TaxID=1292023 RepID=UPI00036FF4FF|nr:ABC transporter substrate-binding protein [Leucobacter sp. UCD-THU]EYT51852.1 peptide ABC transporter substrate-binding protein [Leucobacter sp. UCD-THU]